MGDFDAKKLKPLNLNEGISLDDFSKLKNNKNNDLMIINKNIKVKKK